MCLSNSSWWELEINKLSGGWTCLEGESNFTLEQRAYNFISFSMNPLSDSLGEPGPEKAYQYETATLFPQETLSSSKKSDHNRYALSRHYALFDPIEGMVQSRLVFSLESSWQSLRLVCRPLHLFLNEGLNFLFGGWKSFYLAELK